MSCGAQEWTLILIVVLLVFGVPKLPALGSAIGRTVRNFRRASNNADEIKVRRREKQGDPPEES